MLFETLEARLVPATLTWDGGGTTNNWSEAANWSTNVVPGSSDTAIFDGTSTKAATVDASFAGTLTQLQINSGYTGTVTLNRNLTLQGAFTQAAGTLAEQGNTLTITTDFTSTGGTFNQGQLQLTSDSRKDFQQEVVAPSATSAFHGDAVLRRVLLE